MMKVSRTQCEVNDCLNLHKATVVFGSVKQVEYEEASAGPLVVKRDDWERVPVAEQNKEAQRGKLAAGHLVRTRLAGSNTPGNMQRRRPVAGRMVWAAAEEMAALAAVRFVEKRRNKMKKRRCKNGETS
ncbi:hypothetical protein Droror1_Dr00019812 [Drosera rotundifolia]